MTSAVAMAAALMLVAIALWMTDFWHHISPAMVGLGIGLVAVLPVVGVLNIDDMKKLNYLPVFFVAAAVCMGNVLLATKALDLLTNAMMGWMQGLISNPVIRSQGSRGVLSNPEHRHRRRYIARHRSRPHPRH